jgi:hypothetical protein
VIQLPTGTRIWLAAGVTDMRRGFDGLSAQVQTVLQQQPFSGHVFLFRGRRGDIVKCLWFDGDGRMKFALENRFFASLGIDPECPCFNSGAMLVDTREWKRQGCFDRIIEFCTKYPKELRAADQTALNALYSTNCFALPAQFNVKLSSVERKCEIDSGIYHFLGSPKPWDLLGSLFHPYYSTWVEALRGTGLPFWMKSPWFNGNSWGRLPKIIGGYRRIAVQRYKLALKKPKPQPVRKQGSSWSAG